MGLLDSIIVMARNIEFPPKTTLDVSSGKTNAGMLKKEQSERLLELFGLSGIWNVVDPRATLNVEEDESPCINPKLSGGLLSFFVGLGDSSAFMAVSAAGTSLSWHFLSSFSAFFANFFKSFFEGPVFASSAILPVIVECDC